MPTQYPTALDNFTNPSSTDTLGSSTVPHAAQHANINDAVEALETKVGTDASTDPTSLEYRVNTLEAGAVNGWRDLIGDITPKTTGPGAPTLDVITGNIRGFRYSVGDDGDVVYHVPHDYVPGTDLFLHPHWTHNGTNISGSFVITFYVTYAKGHQQASFHAQKTLTITDGSLDITNTPALYHRIPEAQLSTVGGSASQLDTSLIEVDGLILVHYDVTTIPTITGGTGEPFILTLDIHYQSNSKGTLNKAPDFYS